MLKIEELREYIRKRREFLLQNPIHQAKAIRELDEIAKKFLAEEKQIKQALEPKEEKEEKPKKEKNTKEKKEK